MSRPDPVARTGRPARRTARPGAGHDRWVEVVEGARVALSCPPRRTGVEPPAEPGTQRRFLRPVLTEPDTAPMSAEQHERAINTLAAMIVAWRRRSPAVGDQSPDRTPGQEPGPHERSQESS